MTEAAGQLWHRAKYPLQMHHEFPSTGNLFTGGDSQPAAGHTSDDPAKWHRAVTDGTAATAPVQSVQLKTSSSRLSAGNLSQSQYPLSPPSTIYEDEDPDHETHDDLQSKPTSNGGHDGESASQMNVYKHSNDSGHTLRRSAGSQRLRAEAIETSDVLAHSQSSTPDSLLHGQQSSSDVDGTGASASDTWRRTIYPLQDALQEPDSRHVHETKQQHELVPDDNGARKLDGDVSQQTTVSHGGAFKKFDAKTTMSPQTISDAEGQSNYRSAAQANPWRRQKYPLQMPVSRTNLRQLPTPPPSPESQPKDGSSPHTGKTHAANNDNKQPGPLRRGAYPLQAPASIVDLRQQMPTSQSTSDGKAVGARPIEAKPESSQGQAKDQKFRRQGYPLQSQASIPALRQPPSQSVESGFFVKDGMLSTQSENSESPGQLADSAPHESYHPQSKDESQLNSQFAASSTSGNVAGSSGKAEPVHLPKNMRAVTDANAGESKGRTIVVCLDGTGDKFDNDNSNIVYLISALKKDDPRQVSYYQAGIGTYSSTGLSSGWEAAADMAVGASLGPHVQDAYRFLMHSYKEGDRICIFGFSRGAYTARCLGGMLHKVGLLPPRNLQQIPFAYEFYANDTDDGWKQSADFKATFCIDVCVDFIGCFDSVASVGFIPKQLPLSTTPTNKPRYFRHAMSLDERRAKFKICRHETKHWDSIETSSSAAHFLHSLPNHKDQDDKPPWAVDYEKKRQARHPDHPNITDAEYAHLHEHEAPFETDVLEVWFAGDHCDVGGGNMPNEERHKLAQIPLRWMIRQTFECNTGIIWKTKMLAEFGLDVHTLWPKYSSLSVPQQPPPPTLIKRHSTAGLPAKSVRRSKLIPIDRFEHGERFYHLKSHTDEDWTPEQTEDFFDAISDIHDVLGGRTMWWLLEFWPVQFKVPVAPGQVELRTGMNLGRWRGVDDLEPNVHWTVLRRAQHMGYKIRARAAKNTNWKIVV